MNGPLLLLLCSLSAHLASAGGDKRTVIDDINDETKKAEQKMEETGIPQGMRDAGDRVSQGIDDATQKIIGKKKRGGSR